jgi:transposase InsO family protein
MDHPGPVRVRQRRGRVRAHPRHQAVRKLAAASHDAQRLALDQLGDQEGTVTVRGELVERRDVAVPEPGDGLGLARHPRRAVLAVNDLYRDGALQPLVPGPVDGGEAAAPDLVLDPESAQDSLSDHGPLQVRSLTSYSCRRSGVAQRLHYMRRGPCSYS